MLYTRQSDGSNLCLSSEYSHRPGHTEIFPGLAYGAGGRIQGIGTFEGKMKILVACIHYSVSSGRYITRALRRLGHEVRTIGPAPGRMIWGFEVEAKWEWKPDYESDLKQWPTMDIVMNRQDGWQPELIITADSAFTITGHTNQVPHILWGMDNHVRDYWPREMKFKEMFFAHSWGHRINEPNAHWFPPCYDPQAHIDLDFPIRDIDVCMIGYPYQERVEIMNAMKEAGLNTFSSIGALWDEYNLIYNRAKIALVKSSHGDLTQRFFENMAQGCCVLADEVQDARKLGFIPGIHYMQYKSVAGAVDKAQYLLQSGKWIEIAKCGQTFAAPHTWDARAQVILKVAGL